MLYWAQEIPMRVNSTKSLELGESIHEEFGSWDKALKAAELHGNVYVLPPKGSRPQTAKARRSPPKAK
jgi:hypothetical protein